jgi:hypothetical protein
MPDHIWREGPAATKLVTSSAATDHRTPALSLFELWEFAGMESVEEEGNRLRKLKGVPGSLAHNRE